MCGRYASLLATADVAQQFGIECVIEDTPGPSRMVTPSQRVRLITERIEEGAQRPVRALRASQWGLAPSWAKDASAGVRMTTARMSTVTQKPSFRSAASKRRALVPADGFYVNPAPKDGRAAQYLRAADGSQLAFAALFEWWRDPGCAGDDPARWIMTSLILTAPVRDHLGEIYGSAPVIVPPALRSDWLNYAVTDLAIIRDLLVGLPVPALVADGRNGDPELRGSSS
jgi:putative SOS response-associated peptidase YedK